VVEYNLGKYDEALADFNSGLKYEPNQPIAYRKRGMIKVIKKDYDGAMQDLDKALTLNPRLAHAYIDKGQIMYIKGKYDIALSYLDTAIEIDPAIKDAFNSRAVIRMAMKDTLGAQEDGQRAAAMPD
jgi:tetratricopeptide (TPR) repeat protein